MTKLTREEKIEIYEKKKEGVSYSTLSKTYKVKMENIVYLIKLIDIHGKDILRKNKNKYYSKELKEEIINKVLLYKQPVHYTALEYGLPSNGMLVNWIKLYKENGYVIVEKRRGRKSTMNQKKEKVYKDMTNEEKIKYLENKNLYLEAENEYLKKLRAVVQERKNRQLKKK